VIRCLVATEAAGYENSTSSARLRTATEGAVACAEDSSLRCRPSATPVFRVTTPAAPPNQCKERIAEAMTFVTASGCEISVRCEPPGKTVIRECARFAMAISELGVMI
jgi:hypothetical protein